MSVLVPVTSTPATPRRRTRSAEETLVVSYMLVWLPMTGPPLRLSTLKIAGGFGSLLDVLVSGCVPVLIFDERRKRVQRVASLE